MMEYLVLNAGQWEDVQAVLRERELEVYFSKEPDGIHVYGPEDILQEIENILWSIQVLDGLSAVFDGVAVPYRGEKWQDIEYSMP